MHAVGGEAGGIAVGELHMSKGGSVQWVKWDGKTHGKIVRGPHQMTKRVLNWPYCSRCGLVALRNDATRIALKAQCVTEEDA